MTFGVMGGYLDLDPPEITIFPARLPSGETAWRGIALVLPRKVRLIWMVYPAYVLGRYVPSPKHVEPNQQSCAVV